MPGPDAWVCVFPHGHGEAGDRPAAILEVWWLEATPDQPCRVTFGGVAPRGTKGWPTLVWGLVAAEAARCAQPCGVHGGLKYSCGCPIARA